MDLKVFLDTNKILGLLFTLSSLIFLDSKHHYFVKMEVITVADVVSDYKKFNISNRKRLDKNRILNGLCEILANRGLKLKITEPQSESFKAIKRHYCHIIKSLNPSDAIFYSIEKYPDLCVVDKEMR